MGEGTTLELLLLLFVFNKLLWKKSGKEILQGVKRSNRRVQRRNWNLEMYQMKIESDENAQPESHKIRLVHHGIMITEVDCLKKDSTFSKVT